jgi:hypothetical protein
MCRRPLIVTGADSEKTHHWITPLEMPLEPSVRPLCGIHYAWSRLTFLPVYKFCFLKLCNFGDSQRISKFHFHGIASKFQLLPASMATGWAFPNDLSRLISSSASLCCNKRAFGIG